MEKTKGKRTASEKDALAVYLAEINRIPLLTKEEEYECAVAARNGDEEAKKKLIQANLRFVVNVAKKYQNQGISLADLISEGNIGLMNAADRFNPDLGYHFISYAVWWIRQAVLKAVCEKSRMIRLPLNRANELVQIERLRKQSDGSLPEQEELARISRDMGIAPSLVQEILNAAKDVVSLDAPADRSRGLDSVGDRLEDDRYESPEEFVMDSVLRSDIRSVLDTLSSKEAEVLKLRYGLEGRKPMSLKEIGDVFGLTKERIRQIEKKAIRHLQVPAKMARLEAYVA
ncbi:MAG: RNA polymerase sigma factor RpoD/SigA [Spirochaetes bacterium]|uniref:RNA polymerase sigma factor n=1 Tax=Candidatus Avitreponema avistercoris TaxID=2840705 RepID=A0A9D9EPH6_9SPIR|nr:RNA polymerase sigma factor RpoD/SigA [Candidatus Avitreponema avistercoris]